MELRLTKSGITVFDQPTSTGNNSAAAFYVNINTVKLVGGAYSFSINSYILEAVRLTRPIPKLYGGFTWNTGYTGYVGKDNMPTSIRQGVNGEVDSFINDYLAQNPKL